MSTNVIRLPQPKGFGVLSADEIELVSGGTRVSNAALATGAAVWTVWTAAFYIGYEIGKDIGEAIFD